MATMASGLNNPNIVHLNGHGVGTLNYNGKVTNNVKYMIFEYCRNRDLFQYARLGRFTERQAKYIFKKILLGVQALHAAGYCHRDLKVDNILLDQNDNPKIADFALTTLCRQNNQPIVLNDFVGPRNFCSPQIHDHQPYNGEKNDIFSLGAILIMLVTGRTGFNESRVNDPCYQFIRNGNIPQYWNHWDHFTGDHNNNYSNEFKDLYIRMVSFNENNRPTIAQILNHHWFDEINNMNEQQLNQLEENVINEFLARANQIQANQVLNAANHINDDNDDNGP
jgi:serine/threonine protein kinase